jgi:hypothetical protein
MTNLKLNPAGLGLAIAAATLSGASSRAQSPISAERFWPQWRGPDATGVSKHANPPIVRNENKNIRKAIRLADASGDVTGSKAIIWSLDRDTPYVPSPSCTTAFGTC